MSKDVVSGEPNLNLEPGVLEKATKEIAKLYLDEISFKKETQSQGVWGEQPQISRATYEQLITKDEAWRKVAGNFPDLSMQILGALRFALKKARSVEDRYTTTQVEMIADPLTHDITFTGVGTKQFLEDIFIRRIMIEGQPEFAYILDSPILGAEKEAEHMRKELGIEKGICRITLQDAVKAVLTSRLSLTRQTPPPVKIS